MKKIILLLSALLLITLTGCDDASLYDKVLNELASKYKNEVDFSKHCLIMLQGHDFSLIESNTDPHLKDEKLRPNLEKLSALFPVGQPIAVKLIGLNRNDYSNGKETGAMTAVSFEYEFPDKWLEADMTLQNQAGNTTIAGIHILPLPDSLENINKFTLRGKGITHYIVLIVALIVPTFIVLVLIACIRTPLQKRKWLWILFILFGFLTIQLNWTTGSVNINPLCFQLLGAGFVSSCPYSPWIMSVSIPLGAIVFLVRRRKLITKESQINSY